MSTAEGNGDLIPNVLSEETGQSSFACSHCRRQKVKCDRLLPQCGNCTKSSRICNYPLTVQKPGPKAGTHRRPRHSVTDDGISPNHGSKRTRIGGDDGATPGNYQRSSYDSHKHRSPQARKESVDVNSRSSPTSHRTGPNPLYTIVHPSHEPMSDEHIITEIDLQQPTPSDASSFSQNFSHACDDLGVSSRQGRELISLYFENMTAFSLFHRPTLEQKLSSIPSLEQLKAFLAAIFAFGLRFAEGTPHFQTMPVPQKSMLDFAFHLHLHCLEQCGDNDPPLHLLQSYFLTTFQKLVHGVRGRSWRMLGDCVRIAFEIKIHLVDLAKEKNLQTSYALPRQDWVVEEEHRRLWWALWECDIFASTIRRMPCAIDWNHNKTFLPCPDENWFKGEECSSCFLDVDPGRRWRDLVASGNRSPTAWFILVNSLMWDAHKLGVIPRVWAARLGVSLPEAEEDNNPEVAKVIQRVRDLLDNALHCAVMNLPSELNADNRYLSFRSEAHNSANNKRFIDAAGYSIHIMFQLARFQLYSRELYYGAVTGKRTDRDVSITTESKSSSAEATPVSENAAGRQLWGRYVDASASVADVIRNSAPNHYQFVNPFLVNTIWFAAAAQVVARLFGPQSIDRHLAASNFDLLTGTLSKYETFWETPTSLKHKLNTLEEQLQQMRRADDKTTSTAQQQHQQGDNNNTKQLPQPTPSLNISLDPSSYVPQQQPRTGNIPIEPNIPVSSDTWTTSNPVGNELLAQDFNLDSPSAFAGGQFDLLQQPNIYDAFFDANSTWSNGGLNFNELFMYPYQ